MPHDDEEFPRIKFLENRGKLSGKQAGRAARLQAIQNLIRFRRKEKAGTKAKGLNPGDINVEEQIRRRY